MHPHSRKPTPQVIRQQFAIPWRSLVFNHIPFFGNAIRQAAVEHLIQSADRGEIVSARLIADTFKLTLPPSTTVKIKSCLLNLHDPEIISALWEDWSRSRSPELGSILAQVNQPALANSPAYVISHLRLHSQLAIRSEGSFIIDPLTALAADSDPDLAKSARELLISLKNQAAIDQLCLRWVETRSPLLQSILADANYSARRPPSIRTQVALKFNQAEVVIQAGSEVIGPLAAACQDPDQEIATNAQACLLNLQNQNAINELCSQWSKTRGRLLENAILKAHYLADKPLSLRLLVLLKTNRLEQACQTTPETLGDFLVACQDQDQEIAENAKTALRSLSNPATIEAFCQRVIDSGGEFEIQAALQAGYLPANLEKRAAFLFLTGQMPAYEALDFDHRILQTVFEVAKPPLKSRITRLVQASGKTDYLSILAGMDFKSRAGEIGNEEIATLVHLLTSNQEWEKLWNLAFELPLRWGIEIVRSLSAAAWQPASENEAALLSQLSRLSNTGLNPDSAFLSQALPLALKRSSLKVRGRVNALAFANDASILAIGTGERKLGLWEFQKGEVVRKLDGFSHSISQLAYCGSQLLCGQRSVKNSICSIYGWHNDQSYLLGSHVGAVTGLAPVNDNQVLSTGRDQKVILWDLVQRKPVAEAALPFLAQAAAISADHQTAALVHDSISLLHLPDLTPQKILATNGLKSGVHKGSGRAVAFAPAGQGVLVGQFNGQVVFYENQPGKKLAKLKRIAVHPSPINGLQFIPGHSRLVSSSDDGQVIFSDWNRFTTSRELSTGLSLSSLQISADGSFMATGTRNALIVLWDLRVLNIPGLVDKPLANIKPGQIAALNEILAEESLNPIALSTLTFFNLLVQHRFQYDVELDEAPRLAKGEFDVIID